MTDVFAVVDPDGSGPRLWFQRVRRPGPAMGNILVFEKASGRRGD